MHCNENTRKPLIAKIRLVNETCLGENHPWTLEISHDLSCKQGSGTLCKGLLPFLHLGTCCGLWSKRSKSAVAKSHYICIKSRSTASARLSANAHWLQTHWQRWLTDGWTGGWTDGQADGCYLVHCLPALRSIIMNSSGDITKQLYFQSVDWKGDRK